MLKFRKLIKTIFKLEDDVITRHGFLNDIKKKIIEVQTTEWKTIEFSELGLIGKLFQTKDLSIFVNFLLVFSIYKPVDLLNDMVYIIMACGNKKIKTYLNIS